MKQLVSFCLGPVLLFNVCATTAGENLPPGIDPVVAEIHAGLVVQLGAEDLETPAHLARTGRYLIHVLDSDANAAEKARSHFQHHDSYGLVTIEQIASSAQLPFTENLVNLVIVRKLLVSPNEIFRVLTPGGAVLVPETNLPVKQQLEGAGFSPVTEARSAGSPLLLARKPWPEQMGTWSHSRHAADGNAVSPDTMVGPPERVRWIAAATREVEGLVADGGRNFYGGTLARDSFNGLRLWHHNLRSGEHNNVSFALPSLPANVARPVAGPNHLYAVLRETLVALDAASGIVVIEFPNMTQPRHLALQGQILIAADENFVRAYSTEDGRELWHFLASAPNNLVVNEQMVCFVQGRPRRGDQCEALALELRTGDVKWRNADYPWLNSATRAVLHKDHLAFEVSSFNDHDDGNAIHVLSSSSGILLWEKFFPPGMNHHRQARALFLDSGLWILHGGKTNTVDKDNTGRLPIRISALDPFTGEIRVTHHAGMTHCFPPIATPNYLFAGVLHLTELSSGQMLANPITKAHCSRENGWVPAHGLVYTTPKHCTCWPMLRGYVALAPRLGVTSPAQTPIEQLEFALEKGPAKADPQAANPQSSDWPLYRNDRWRSGSTRSPGPKSLNTQWSASLARKLDLAAFGDAPLGPILHDWRENPFVKGPLSAPTVAHGLVFVSRPNAHEVIAVNASSGAVRWRFTANGRVDTPPAIHRGVCLFGSANGFVYALDAASGELVWRLQAAPANERIVAYGQVESPWPVPGAVLLIDDVAYFAAGRQSFADGGILLFAVNPLTGERHWVRRLDTVPQKGYYENSGLEFDPFDILHQEGNRIAMSRWLFSRDGRSVEVDKWDAFARIDTGSGAAYMPRGSWTYGPRQQHRFPGEPGRRALCVVRDGVVFGALDGTTEMFRRDFDLENGEIFTNRWMTGWEAARIAREGGRPFRTYRLAEQARWQADHFTPEAEKRKPKPRGAQLYNDLYAMALSGDNRLFVIHKDGRLKSLSADDGRVLAERRVPPPAWDGLAIANERLFLTTQTGELLCLGE
jgi:outer membrane protein assembly factor BamB